MQDIGLVGSSVGFENHCFSLFRGNAGFENRLFFDGLRQSCFQNRCFYQLLGSPGFKNRSFFKGLRQPSFQNRCFYKVFGSPGFKNQCFSMVFIAFQSILGGIVFFIVFI